MINRNIPVFSSKYANRVNRNKLIFNKHYNTKCSDTIRNSNECHTWTIFKFFFIGLIMVWLCNPKWIAIKIKPQFAKTMCNNLARERGMNLKGRISDMEMPLNTNMITFINKRKSITIYIILMTEYLPWNIVLYHFPLKIWCKINIIIPNTIWINSPVF